MEKLFSNKIKIDASEDTVRKVLLDVPSMMKWNPEISKLTKISEDTYDLHRDNRAINQNEKVTLIQEDGKIIFSSVGDRLNYRLEFKLKTEDNVTKLHEKVFVDASAVPVPLSLIAPITKHAFNQNLNALKALVEFSTTH
jgi:predicted ribosome-associated RNA-binding protein Tma20